MRGDCEREPNVHSRRIAFYRRIKEFFDFGKSDDLIELPSNFALRHAREWRR